MAFVGYNNSGLAMLGQGIDALGTSFRDIQKQQRLADLGQKIQSGDIPGAAKVAFDAGDTSTGLKLMTLGLQQQSSKNIAPILGMPTDPNATPDTPTTTGISPAPVGGFGNAVNRTLGFEGGMNSNDSNGAPSNYGINAAANSDINVAGLTPDKAKALYKSRYWDTLGLDNVDPRLAHVVFDTAVNAGPAKAQELMDASGGDPNKFLALRTQFHGDLLKSNPEKFGPYAKAWSDRLANLRADINAPGGGAQVASADSSFATQAGSGAVASDNANAAKRTYLQTAQSRIIAAMAQPNLDEGTRSALKSKLDIVNKNLADIKSEEDKAFTTMTPEEFQAAYPGQQYPANAIVGKDAAGKPAVIHLSNERIPNDYTKSQERARVLQDQGIDPNSPQGREYILTGKTDVATQMKATEQKTFDTENNKVLTLQQSIADLQKAKQLNPLAYSGNYQPGAMAWAHRNLPSGVGDLIADPKAVTATTQFENLVVGASASLGKDLFGARVTNYDEQLLQKLRANPQMAPDERAAIIDQMITHRMETLKESQSKLAEMKQGTRYQRQPQGVQSQSQQQQAPDVLGQAREAIARGADRNAVIQRLQQNGIDAGGL